MVEKNITELARIGEEKLKNDLVSCLQNIIDLEEMVLLNDHKQEYIDSYKDVYKLNLEKTKYLGVDVSSVLFQYEETIKKYQL